MISETKSLETIEAEDLNEFLKVFKKRYVNENNTFIDYIVTNKDTYTNDNSAISDTIIVCYVRNIELEIPIIKEMTFTQHRVISNDGCIIPNYFIRTNINNYINGKLNIVEVSEADREISKCFPMMIQSLLNEFTSYLITKNIHPSEAYSTITSSPVTNACMYLSPDIDKKDITICWGSVNLVVIHDKYQFTYSCRIPYIKELKEYKKTIVKLCEVMQNIEKYISIRALLEKVYCHRNNPEYWHTFVDVYPVHDNNHKEIGQFSIKINVVDN